MADPTPQEVSVAVQALRTDARTWGETADELAAARDAAIPLGLQKFHFSFVGDKAGLTEVYAGIQEKIIQLLGEGSTQLEALSAALTGAANDYERSDNDAYRRAHHVY
ncbi:hypothetical protein [Paractinoplanes durhamensis]|uniref:Uncharacterized protein n=1 Tax=Paractinoplanes durhamensis TaxID=113563 RepID=A0ABQ3YVH2_9ACTN|nr:hypothetical protein [Actinoplanes durhamensis]GIE01536.1 hypothetical protein Adu01nite_28860 [Actinoplanes durhamensis]